MKTHRVNKVKAILNQIEAQMDKKMVKQLELEKCRRMIDRLAEFSSDCELCTEHFAEFDNYLSQLSTQKDSFTKREIKEHRKFINQFEAHLFDEHKLISQGYYKSIYMSLGMSVGLIFGLIFFDQVALGLPIGLVIGLAIGSGRDEVAKKEGRTI